MKKGSLVDLDRRAAGSAGDFGEAMSDGARDSIQALCARASFTKGRDRLAGIAANADARINFNFAKHGHAIGDGGFRAFAVAENVDGLAALRASQRAHVL